MLNNKSEKKQCSSSRILMGMQKRFSSRRRRKQSQQTSRRWLQVELLENRRLLTGDYEFEGAYSYDVSPLLEASVAATTSVTFNGAGNIAITDTGGSSSNITIKRFSDGVNDFVEIADANAQFIDIPLTTPASTLSSDQKTLRIPLNNITGTITINTAGGNDNVTLDFSGGNIHPAGGIVFNGGLGGDDSLRITGYNLSVADGITDVSVVHHSADSGTVMLAGLGTIDFDEIEPLMLSTALEPGLRALTMATMSCEVLVGITIR